jgi:hypothetical protein
MLRGFFKDHLPCLKSSESQYRLQVDVQVLNASCVLTLNKRARTPIVTEVTKQIAKIKSRHVDGHAASPRKRTRRAGVVIAPAGEALNEDDENDGPSGLAAHTAPEAGLVGPAAMPAVAAPDTQPVAEPAQAKALFSMVTSEANHLDVADVALPRDAQLALYSAYALYFR